ncbi:MAG: FAD-dependent oxidoreductase [Candidatus Aenigmarchaeota archaeon]|nr:FAD-dependent oxidoreductase [Candidatus Aenigmarchaeota archaeon]NCO96729.1 FAD-dependent oxidoreductase [Candidatus Aenigmarchaeota archaeon]NCS71031.1 FAD-dependent oxidoreductase [Candidatus Aenigmarchaeota archaeon]
MKIGIVGAGPAGLFSAYKLSQKKGLDVTLIDMGKRVENRTPKDIMCGIGGAGTFSDGKLHFSPVLSHEKILHLFSIPEYQKYLDQVDKIFIDFGVNSEYYPKDMDKANEFVEEAKKRNIRLVIRKIKHVGTDKLPPIMKSFQDYLEDKKVNIINETQITDLLINDSKCCGIVSKSGEKLKFDKIILATGRINAKWLQDLSLKYKIPYDYDKIEVGVRVEFPAIVMKKYSDLMYEAIFMLQSKTFEDVVRTFCPCPNGLVGIEDYEGFVCVNGHSNSDHLSENSNFALVSEVVLTEPIENTTEYAKSIAQLATTIGGGKPILQRLEDLKKGRRSTWGRIKKGLVDPTLKDVVPGDISMALPHRVVVNIIEGLEKLDKVMPGINSGSTLLYAPEIKLRSSKIRTSKYLETSVKNLFVAGDGAGVSGNIVGAAATGLIAGEGIIKSI